MFTVETIMDENFKKVECIENILTKSILNSTFQCNTPKPNLLTLK